VILALVPVTECFPLLYANETGLFEKAGMSVAIELYPSQADCDTALAGHATGGLVDGYSASSRHLGKTFEKVCRLTGGGWGVVASSVLRFKGIKDLKERVVGTSRNDASEYFLKMALKSGGLGSSQVMMPRVGNFRIRASMLENNQLEAAVLPQPYFAEVVARGGKSLYKVPHSVSSSSLLVVKPAACSKEHRALLQKVYDQAVDSLEMHGRRLLPSLWHHYAGMPLSVADTMRLPKFSKSSSR